MQSLLKQAGKILKSKKESMVYFKFFEGQNQHLN